MKLKVFAVKKKAKGVYLQKQINFEMMKSFNKLILEQDHMFF